MIEQLRSQIKSLSATDRLLLVEEIWDDLSSEGYEFELTQEQKEELDERSNSYKMNPEQGRSWNDIKAAYLNKK